MKKTITLISLLLLSSFLKSQTTVADFESFILPVDSFYYSPTNTAFSTVNATFPYEWNTGFGGYWASGFAYTNKNDTSNGGYLNPYNCAAYKGYNNSNFYVSCQDKGVIRLIAPHNYVNGFYITNNTYAYKSMKYGDSFAKKFGGTSGNDPDWFKVTVKGFLGGTMKTDSSVFYLADFRFSNNNLDYIERNWQYVDCSVLGNVDSLKFFMYSSDTTAGFINTPTYFCIDNFSTSKGVGISEFSSVNGMKLFPNPVHDIINLSVSSDQSFSSEIKIYDAIGIQVQNQNTFIGTGTIQIDLKNLADGLYFIEINSNSEKRNIKFIKN